VAIGLVVRREQGVCGELLPNWWGKLREREHLGDPDVDGRVLLRRIYFQSI